MPRKTKPKRRYGKYVRRRRKQTPEEAGEGESITR